MLLNDTDSYVPPLTLHCEKPSPKRMISAIMAESGTIMAMGRNMLVQVIRQLSTTSITWSKG